MVTCSPTLKRWGAVVLDLFFPRSCVGCNKVGSLLCPSCRRQLSPVGPACPVCGRPQADKARCPSCWARVTDIDSIRSPYRFQDLIRRAIHELKYHRLTAMALPLAGLLADYLAAEPLETDLLVPVPLHPKRLRERGYNQSTLLARELGRLTGLPLDEAGLRRNRDAPPQVRSSSAEDRLANVAGAFVCESSVFRGARITLVDDVCTSGATLETCASVLRSGGAARITGLTVAREI